MKAEYAQQPERFRLCNLPNGKVQIELRENIAQEQRETELGTLAVWTADEHYIVKSPRPGLEADVSARTDIYIAYAKAQEAAIEREKKLKECNAATAASIPDAVVELAALISEQEDALVELAALLN